jgi:hypothetical protein
VATGRPHFMGQAMSWRTVLLLCALQLLCGRAYGFASIYCGKTGDGKVSCYAQTQAQSEQEASELARVACGLGGRADCTWVGSKVFQNTCQSVASPIDHSNWYTSPGNSYDEASSKAIIVCQSQNRRCETLVTACDFASPQNQPKPTQTAQQSQTPEPSVNPTYQVFTAVAKFLDDIRTGIGLGLGILIVIVAFAKRAAIHNYLVHGNLPFKPVNLANDIEVLFTRTQRVNWYGRVVFGIVARLGMTDHQLLLVRRYWLGRVIAFDSLRRQRQNQLAKIHLQLAASGGAPPKDRKPISQLWSSIKMFFFLVLYLFRALFSFLFGFLFIRVTIAKLVRGKLIESSDLVLILQAKDAIEQSAKYLKEYLVTAETFNGEEELFEPERPVDTVLAPLHRRGQTQP